LYANSEEQTFLHIQYKDILNRPHDEYYEVAPVLGSSIIDRNTGRALFEEAAPIKRVSLRNLTVDKVSHDLTSLMKAQTP
jgi:hypothetical protein